MGFRPHPEGSGEDPAGRARKRRASARTPALGGLGDERRGGQAASAAPDARPDRHVEGREPHPIVEPDFRAPREGDSLEPLEGTYDLGSPGRVTVTADGDRVFFRVGEGAEHEGFLLGVYTVPDFYARIWFSEMRDGRYQKLHWLSLLGETTGNRVPGHGSRQRPGRTNCVHACEVLSLIPRFILTSRREQAFRARPLMSSTMQVPATRRPLP